MTHSYRIAFAFLFVTSSFVRGQTATLAAARPGWSLTWSDEFNAPDGSPVDTTKWVSEVGGNGWGNQELEYYTARPENAFQQGGDLVIKVLQEKYTGSDKVTRDYTSARLKTLGKFSQKYGRFEARIKIPQGQGIWPAFWMMGNNIATVNWPKCGEIDVMENIGKEPALVHGTIHGPGYSGDKGPRLSLFSPTMLASPMISIPTPSSGSPRLSVFTSTTISIPLALRLIFPKAPSGYTTTHFSFC